MIEIKQLTKLFKNGRVIKDVSFTIKQGTILGLVGDNGAGKSTLIKTLFNEIKKDSGKIFYNGKELTGDLMHDFSFFPDQSVYPKNITLYDYAMYAAPLAGIAKKEADGKIMQLLQNLDLVEYKKKTFAELSSGMQKRALILICLVTSPKVIVLDEPTANLDVKNRTELLNLLKVLAQSGKTILITSPSHIIDELQNLIDQLVIIKDGKVVYDKPFNGEESLKKIYFASSSEAANIKYEEIAKIVT